VIVSLPVRTDAARAARGRPIDEVGDLDFLVEFRDIDPDGYADAYFGLLEALERRFGRRIDLVMASTISNPYVVQSIARHRTVLCGT
jgi:predicted nucleotidyltransferase